MRRHTSPTLLCVATSFALSMRCCIMRSTANSALASRWMTGVLLRFVAGLSVALLAVPAPPQAKAIDPVTGGAVVAGGAVVGKMLLGSFLDDLEKKASKLLDQARESGDLVAAHAASKMELLVGDLRHMLFDLQKKSIDDLDIQLKKLLLNVNSMMDNIKPDLRGLTELTALDLRQIVNRVALLAGEGDGFYVSSFRGIVLSKQDNDYKVTIRGVGLSFPGNDPACEIAVAVDDQELNGLTSIVQEENNEVNLYIPAKLVNPKFKEKSLAIVPITLLSIITKTEGPSKARTTRTHGVKTHLILLPESPGSLEVEETIEAKEWGPPETKTVTMTRTAPGNEDRVEEVTVPPGQKISGVTYECKDPRGGWCYALRQGPQRGAYDADYDILEGGRKAICYRKLGTAPLTCFYHLQIQSERTVYRTVKHQIDLKFDKRFVLKLSPDNKSGTFKIQGRLVTGHEILLTSGNLLTGGKDNPLTAESIETVGDHKEVTLILTKTR